MMTIIKVIDDIGCPKHLKGYNVAYYMLEAYLKGYKKMDAMYAYTKRFTGFTQSSSERALRHMIRHMLAKNDITHIKKYFGASLQIDGHITNKQFIFTLGDAIERDEGAEHVNNKG